MIDIDKLMELRFRMQNNWRKVKEHEAFVDESLLSRPAKKKKHKKKKFAQKVKIEIEDVSDGKL